MSRLQYKSTFRPDEIRQFLGHGRAEITSLDEWTVQHFMVEPGWRWSQDVAPIVKTPTCQMRHLGIVISGRFHVEADDGAVADFGPGDIYEIPPGHDAWVVGDDRYESWEFTSGRMYALPPDEDADRRLVTLVFTDIVDSTGQLERLGDTRWREVLLSHYERLRSQIDLNRGREVSTTGDGLVAVFETPARAVRCAAAMADAVRDLGIEIRLGVHTGEVEFVGGNVRGLAVHLAARVMGLARPGEVLVTSTTHDLLPPSDVQFTSRGPVELKGISGPREVWSLVRD